MIRESAALAEAGVDVELAVTLLDACAEDPRRTLAIVRLRGELREGDRVTVADQGTLRVLLVAPARARGCWAVVGEPATGASDVLLPVARRARGDS